MPEQSKFEDVDLFASLNAVMKQLLQILRM